MNTSTAAHSPPSSSAPIPSTEAARSAESLGIQTVNALKIASANDGENGAELCLCCNDALELSFALFSAPKHSLVSDSSFGAAQACDVDACQNCDERHL
jgi:hypothetical protein